MAEGRRKGRPFAYRQADFRECGFCESAGGGLPSHAKFARSARRVRRRVGWDTVELKILYESIMVISITDKKSYK